MLSPRAIRRGERAIGFRENGRTGGRRNPGNWRDRGKVQQSRELLAPVYGWFTDGFDTRHLKEAKTLPEELAA